MPDVYMHIFIAYFFHLLIFPFRAPSSNKQKHKSSRKFIEAFNQSLPFVDTFKP